MRRVFYLFVLIAVLALFAVLPLLRENMMGPPPLAPEIKAALLDSTNAPAMGNPDGDVTLIEFSDYNCGYCRKNNAEIEALMEADPHLRVIVREVAIFGEPSYFAAKAVLAAEQQGQYGAFHSALMQLSGPADEASVLRLAEDIGLDITKLQADMEMPKIAQHIETSRQIADQLGLMGTPSWVVGDQINFGFMTRSQLEKMVRVARN